MKCQFEITGTIEKNLKIIPKSLHDIYVDLINYTLLLPEAGKPSEYIELHKLMTKELGTNLSIDNACILEHDNSGARSEFFRVNKLEGRMDVSIPFNTVTGIMQLIALSLCPSGNNIDYKKFLTQLYEEIPFIILADQVFSGKSLAGDCVTLRRLVEAVGGPPKQIIAAVCRGANAGINSLSKVFNSVFVVERIPDSMNVFSDDCKFFLAGSRGNEIKSLAKWFRINLVPKGGLLERMEVTLRDPKIGLWGVGPGGWLITTSSNTPNNSLPLLWYSPENNKYIAPYPRVSSRLYKDNDWNIRPLLWDIIENKIRSELRKWL